MANLRRAQAGAAGPPNVKCRWSELLRGAHIESTSRKHRVTSATLAHWRDRFLGGCEAMLKSREVDIEDEEKRRLKSGLPA